MTSRFLLWDFGNTLADQDWMLAAPADVPQWSECWRDTVRGDLANDWFRGHATASDIADHVARATGMPQAATLAHMEVCCRHIRFFMRALDLARTTSLRQAIVTINPDLFSRIAVPHFQLERDFGALVTSWEERTLDKVEMCRTALKRLDPTANPADGLLIDNLEENVTAWRNAGGAGHRFAGESSHAELSSAVATFAAGASA